MRPRIAHVARRTQNGTSSLCTFHIVLGATKNLPYPRPSFHHETPLQPPSVIAGPDLQSRATPWNATLIDLPLKCRCTALAVLW